MNITCNIPDEVVRKIVTSIMENVPEGVVSMDCMRWKYEKLDFTFADYEDGKIFQIGEKELFKAFKLLFSDKWREMKGLNQPPLADTYAGWDDYLCNFDGDHIDAFVQLACFGEVIYG